MWWSMLDMHRSGVAVLVRALTLIIWRPMLWSHEVILSRFYCVWVCMSLSRMVELGGAREVYLESWDKLVLVVVKNTTPFRLVAYDPSKCSWVVLDLGVVCGV